jgi:predicted ATPase
MLQRTVLLTRQDTDDEKGEKLERALVLHDLRDTLPLFTALLSLPTPAQYPPLTLTPQKQKERTLQALLQLLVAQAERQATVLVWEDVHWADPSSLEFLSLLIEQIPTTKLLLVLIFRPEFTPPWKPRSHLSQLVLNRLGRKQVKAMIEKMTTGNALSAAVIEQIHVKTDGVPLFVEELTKSVIETFGAQGHESHQPLAIPATLQEALLARLDRLPTARPVAQLGATLGREFSYELLHAVAPIQENDLQTSLVQLVEAEILYQRGVAQQTRYFFKHALIQDTAYQSLLRSTRQHYHHQIAQVLEARFPETTEHQPELVAHHYTEANRIAQAIPYWQRAGQKAVERSANEEAVGHLTKGLELLSVLPDTLERAREELILQTTLGHALTAIKGWSDPGVGAAYARSLELCKQIGDSSQLSRVLFGLWAFYVEVPQFQTAQEMGEQLLSLAHQTHDQLLLAEAHFTLGFIWFFRGEIASARDHLQQGIARHALTRGRSRAALYGLDPRVPCRSVIAYALWLLGYPDRALRSSRAALALAQDLSHPYSSAIALHFAAATAQCRGEGSGTQEHAEALIRLCTEQGFTLFLAWGMILRGWALALRGDRAQGIAYIQRGLAASRATGGGLRQPYWLALLAEAYGKAGQGEDGLRVLAEALAVVDRTGERVYEAELYRLKGQLTLQSQVQGLQSKVQEAKECFHKAIEIARQQQAKSLELRAATSLARLWQQQGKKKEAHEMLSEIYNWFTEGFDTKDLQEAKALLDELARDA